MTESVDVRAPQYLSFTIRGTDYGLPILTVKEILQHEQPTSVPGAPPSIRGVINVRGAVVPVIDLAVKFGRGESVATNRTCILVVEPRIAGERLTVGVLADGVNEVLDLPPDAIEPPPAFGSNVRLDYLTGMGKVGKNFVLLLDVDRVISASELELASQTVQAASADAPAALPAEGAAPATPAEAAPAAPPAEAPPPAAAGA